MIALLGAVAAVAATVLVWRSATLHPRWVRGPVWLLRLAAIAVLLAILANPVRRDVAGARGGDTLNLVPTTNRYCTSPSEPSLLWAISAASSSRGST